MNKSIRRLIVGVILLLGVGFYYVFLSPKLANVEKLIYFRHGYVKLVNEIRSFYHLKDGDNYFFYHTPIRVLSKRSQWSYWYSFDGRLVEVDSEHQIMTFLGGDGKAYKFTVPIVQDETGWVKVANEKDKSLLRGSQPPEWFYFNTTDIMKSGDKDNAFNPDQIYTLIWDDSRTLVQIISDYKQSSSELINNDLEQIIYVWR